jgi:ergothioneine biosynthesis protein EgtB
LKENLINQFIESRAMSITLCKGFSEDDLNVQSDKKDTSPGKWHLAHTTWFYECFILKEYIKDYSVFNPRFHFLFNSYYNTLGDFLNREERGGIISPCQADVLAYRHSVDNRLLDFLRDLDDDALRAVQVLIEIGINHEQQHQELFLMDIKHAVCLSKDFSPWMSNLIEFKSREIKEEFLPVASGVYEVGMDYQTEFCFDNETPKHKTYIHDFLISNKLVTNGEYLGFLESEHYRDCNLWLSDAFETIPKHPMYWSQVNGEWYEKTPYGVDKLDLHRPVMHISFFEADAFASFKSCRLPTEAEWEVVANNVETMKGQFNEAGLGIPMVGHENEGFYDLFGSLWQWTKTAYDTFPGYKKPKGSLGEYNAKFTNGLRVLKGGCFQTPKSHFRKTYRNFYAPSKQWPFTGIRLAKDID